MATKTKMTKAQKDSLAKLLAGIKTGQVPAKISKALEELSEPARQAVLSALGILAAARGELPEGMLQSVMEACGVESPDDLIDLISPAEAAPADNEVAAEADSPAPTTPEEPMVTPEQKNTVAKLDDAAKAQIAKAEKSAADATAQVALLQKAATDAEAKRVELEKQVAVERNVRLEKDFLAKAEKLSHLPIKPAELGPVLKALFDVAPEQAAKLEKFLEQTNTKLGTITSLLKEVGHSPRDDADTSAYALLQKAAGELQKAEPKLSAAAAFTKAMELNPKLYEQYNTEQKQ